VWDFTKNTVVSKTTDKTIPTMLPLNRPMFGDPNDVCPLNVINGSSGSATTGVDTGNINTGLAAGVVKGLRNFRDDVLLRSTAGQAVVDAYYQVSPVVARFLLRHTSALKAGRAVLAASEWVMLNWSVCLAAAFALAGACWLLRRRVRAAAAAVLILALALAGTAAHASQIYVPTSYIVSHATEVFAGTVKSAEGRWADGGRIYTDVVVEVADTAKGTLNKASSVSFSVIGGSVGGMVMAATDIPNFKVGEEVVLYLYSVPGRGLVLYGGERGKQVVLTDSATGKKLVTTSDPFAAKAMAEDKKAISEKKAAAQDKDDAAAKAAEAEAKSNQVPLADYMQYLRDLANQEARTPAK